jgi:PAS domain S-box-containing protein
VAGATCIVVLFLGIELRLPEHVRAFSRAHPLIRVDVILSGLAAITVALALLSLLRSRETRRQVSARSEAESALVESERRYRDLVDLSPDAILVHGDGRFLFANDAAARLLGAGAPDELLGKPVLEIVHPDYRRVVEQRLHDEAAGQRAPLLEQRFLRLDGSVVDVEVAGIPITYGGRPAGQIVVRDITDRRHSENRLREAESRYRTLVERVPAVTYIWDARNPTGEVSAEYVSPQVESVLGYSPEEWQRDPGIWEHHVHPDDRDWVLDAWKRASETGESFVADYRFTTRDGRDLWLRDEAVLVSRDERGRPELYQGVLVDVTEQHGAEEQARRAEEKYRSLVEHMAAVSYSCDATDPDAEPVRYVSPQLEQLIGVTPEQWVSDQDSWSRHIHSDDREIAQAGWQTLVDGSDSYDSEYRLISAAGRVVWVRDQSIVTARGDDGHPTRWQGVFFDVTERKRAEDQAREAESRYRTLVEQLPAVVYIDAVDEVSTAFYISPQYEKLAGYTAEERMATPDLWVRILHPDDRERVLAESSRTNETGDPFASEYRLLAKDGHVVWVRDEAILIRDDDGHPVSWQGVLIDVSERKEAEETLRRQDAILKAVGFAAERFLRTSPWEHTIGDVLERLGLAAAASRAYVYENHAATDGTELMSMRFEWAAEGIEAIADDPTSNDFPYHPGFERWERELGAGRVIHGPVSEFPESERRMLASADIRSTVFVPIRPGEETWGFIGFDDCLSERRWSQAEIDALRAAAETLGAAIARQHTEEEVRATQAKYRTLIEQIPAITYITDHGNSEHAVYVSPQVEDLLGYSAEEWITTRGMWRSRIHPDDRERVLAEDDRTELSGDTFIQDYRMIARDGKVVWVRDEAVLVRDPEGNPLFWQGVRLDVTGRKEVDRQLREAEEKYRTLVERIPAITYSAVLGEGAPWLYVSPQVESILGFTPAEWAADPRIWLEQIHPDDVERVMDEENESRDTLRPLVSEYRMYARDGRIVWLRDEAEVVTDDEGTPLFMSGVMLDITERKLAEEQLRDTEAKYRALVEQIPAVLYVDLPDEAMTPVYVSPQIESLLGITVDEYIEDDVWLSRVHPDDREHALAESLRGVGTWEPFKTEYRMLRPDGRELWIRDEAVVLRDEEGKATLVQGVMFDITERKLAEGALRESEQRERDAAEQLRALDELKNTFLAAVSHELRSPLTSILGLALTLERHSLDPDDETDLLARLSANARKLEKLLKDLLDIDRLNRGILTPQLRPMDIGALVRRTIEAMDMLGTRSVLVESDAIVVPVDPPKIERIIENLVVNAAKHTSSDSGIWVRVEQEVDGALIVVEDDGAGVPEGLRADIFEPFRQGPTESRHAPGTGIGLSLVARFAELHGGRAWVEDRIGGGASFRVFLPDHHEDEEEAAEPGGEVLPHPADRLREDGEHGSQPARPAALPTDRLDERNSRAG